MDGDGFVGLPVAHVVHVGDDASAGLELGEEFGAKLQIDFRPQEERDDARGANVGREQILGEKFDAIAHAGAARVLSALRDARGIDIDADAAHTGRAYGGDDDATVTAAEIVEQVAGFETREPYDLGDDVVGRRLVGDVGRTEYRRRCGCFRKARIGAFDFGLARARV